MDQNSKNSMWKNMRPWVYTLNYVCAPLALAFVDSRIIGASVLTVGYTFTRVFKTLLYGGGVEEIPIFFWNLFVTRMVVDVIKEAATKC